jgi:hypothetical protein
MQESEAEEMCNGIHCATLGRSLIRMAKVYSEVNWLVRWIREQRKLIGVSCR